MPLSLLEECKTRYKTSTMLADHIEGLTQKQNIRFCQRIVNDTLKKRRSQEKTCGKTNQKCQVGLISYLLSKTYKKSTRNESDGFLLL